MSHLVCYPKNNVELEWQFLWTQFDCFPFRTRFACSPTLISKNVHYSSCIVLNDRPNKCHFSHSIRLARKTIHHRTGVSRTNRLLMVGVIYFFSLVISNGWMGWGWVVGRTHVLGFLLSRRTIIIRRHHEHVRVYSVENKRFFFFLEYVFFLSLFLVLAYRRRIDQ